MTKLFALAALLGLTTGLAAAAAPPATPAAKPTPRPVTVQAYNVDSDGTTSRLLPNPANPADRVSIVTTDGKLSARQMEARHAKRFNEIERVTATGGVILDADYQGADNVRAVIHGTGDRASYDFAKGIVTLTGNAKLDEADYEGDQKVRQYAVEAAEVQLFIKRDEKTGRSSITRILLTRSQIKFEAAQPEEPAPAEPTGQP